MQFSLFPVKPASFDQARKLHAVAEEKRREVEPDLIRAFEVTMPSRPFRQDVSQTYRVDRSELYSRTAIKSVRNLTTNTISLMVPISQPWCEIVATDDNIQLRHTIKQRLQKVNANLERFFRDSRFYQATASALPNGIIGGVYCIQIIDNRSSGKPIRFKSVPIDELTFLVDYEDLVDCVFRKHMMRLRDLKKRFPTVRQDILDKLGTDEASKHQLVEAVIPNREGSFDYHAWLASGDCSCLSRIQIDWNPFIVARWGGLDANPWGTAPIRDALPNINTANALIEAILSYGEFAAFGAWQTRDINFNRNNKNEFGPGKVLVREDPLDPLELPGQFGLSFEMVDREEARIEQLTFDQPSPTAQQLRHMKAEAVVLMREMFYRQIGEPAIRLTREYLTPLAQQVFERMLERREIVLLTDDEITKMMAEERTNLTPIEFVKRKFRISVNAAVERLRKAEKAAKTIEAVTRASQLFGPQEIAAIVNVPKTARGLLEDLGISADDMRSEAEEKAIRKAAEEKSPTSNLSMDSLVTAMTGRGSQPRDDSPPMQG